jgi:hypothetical protein
MPFAAGIGRGGALDLEAGRVGEKRKPSTKLRMIRRGAAILEG